MRLSRRVCFLFADLAGFFSISSSMSIGASILQGRSDLFFVSGFRGKGGLSTFEKTVFLSLFRQRQGVSLGAPGVPAEGSSLE